MRTKEYKRMKNAYQICFIGLLVIISCVHNKSESEFKQDSTMSHSYIKKPAFKLKFQPVYDGTDKIYPLTKGCYNDINADTVYEIALRVTDNNEWHGIRNAIYTDSNVVSSFIYKNGLCITSNSLFESDSINTIILFSSLSSFEEERIAPNQMTLDGTSGVIGMYTNRLNVKTFIYFDSDMINAYPKFNEIKQNLLAIIKKRIKEI